MSDRRRLALAAAVALASCEMIPGTSAPPPPAASPAAAALDPRVVRARELLKRAESEPLPVVPLPPSPRPRKWVPEPAPAFKPSEVEAVRVLEEAIAADKRRPEAHELLAQALEPAVLRRHQEVQAAMAGKKKASPPPAPPDQGIDTSPARVSRAYRAAIEATPGDGPLIDKLIAYATRVGDMEAADWAYQERIRRARENATAGPLAAYGDFLLDVKKDPLAAAEQYRNVVLWTPGDTRVKGRLAGIYLDMARGHFEKQEYAAAESRVNEAAKYVVAGSPQEATLAAYRSRLAGIRR